MAPRLIIIRIDARMPRVAADPPGAGRAASAPCRIAGSDGSAAGVWPPPRLSATAMQAGLVTGCGRIMAEIRANSPARPVGAINPAAYRFFRSFCSRLGYPCA
jgi:hypothetical protein